MDGCEVREMRLKAGLKQYELAALLHIPQTVLSKIELGQRPLTPQLELQIVKHLQGSVERSAELNGKKEQPTGIWWPWQ